MRGRHTNVNFLDQSSHSLLGWSNTPTCTASSLNGQIIDKWSFSRWVLRACQELCMQADDRLRYATRTNSVGVDDMSPYGWTSHANIIGSIEHDLGKGTSAYQNLCHARCQSKYCHIIQQNTSFGARNNLKNRKPNNFCPGPRNPGPLALSWGCTNSRILSRVFTFLYQHFRNKGCNKVIHLPRNLILQAHLEVVDNQNLSPLRVYLWTRHASNSSLCFSSLLIIPWGHIITFCTFSPAKENPDLRTRFSSMLTSFFVLGFLGPTFIFSVRYGTFLRYRLYHACEVHDWTSRLAKVCGVQQMLGNVEECGMCVRFWVWVIIARLRVGRLG